MGIKGLNSFIIENPEFLKPYELHNSYVVFDGDNLIYSLYYGYKINVLCGGDYYKCAKYIRKYFYKFLECSIQPIVVFDGGYDKSERKLKTIFKRIYDRLSSVKNIAQNKMYNRKVLPILASEVFIYILDELNIPFVVCDYEADDQITALANYYKCPVISADSDFFVSDVQNGFILLDSIETVVSLSTNIDGQEYRYLNCYIYHVDKFLSHFPGIEKTTLPLFGALMGNDYVEQDEFYNFFINIQLPQQERITSILNWLKNKSLSDAIYQCLQYLNKDKQEYIRPIIEQTVASSNLHNCNLQHIINQKLNISKNEILFDSGLITPCGNSLPLDFVINYHSGHYPSYFANIIVLHKLILKPQIDDLEFYSSHICARFIRRIIYGILICHDVDGDTCQNEKCLAPIEEYDRHEIKIEKELVKPIFILDDIGYLPKITELTNLEKERAKLILMKVLGIDLDFFTHLPADWQLFFGSIHYFSCNSFPHCTEAFLNALIVNFIYYEIIKYNNPCKKVIECCNESTTLNHACSSVMHVLLKISHSELQHTKKNLKKYLNKPSINRDNPLCLNILHSYNQLQSCLLSAISLNKLLGSCMKNPSIHRCLNGSLIYNLSKDFSLQPNPELSVAEILGQETTLSVIFAMLNSKIRHGVPRKYILKNTLSCKYKKKHLNTLKCDNLI